MSTGCGGGGASALEASLVALGPFGLYQRYVLVLLCLPNLLAAMYSLNYVFVADQVPFRCLVAQCESVHTAQYEDAVIDQLPAEQCQRYAAQESAVFNGTCSDDLFQPNVTVPCDQFVYQNMDTTFSEFDLGCREWLRTLVGSVRNAALPVALILTGYVSDTWGRRTAICIFSTCAGILGFIKSFSVNYQMYISMEFFEAALGYGFNSAAYIMLLESARPSQRAAFASATGVTYGIGGMLLALAASRVTNWRTLLRAIHPPALLLSLYYLLVEESPLWLAARGRGVEAAHILRRAARWSGKSPNEEALKELSNQCSEEKQSPSWREELWALVRTRVLLVRFLICSWCWIASAFIYYGLTINSVSLSGDKYANFALNMSMEVVASLLLMMALERFGRRRSILVAYLLCGAACVTPYFVVGSRTGFWLFLVGKLAITFAFNSVYVFTAELFPTRTRSSALALCSLVGRVGSVLAPQTPLFSLQVQALVYGVVSLSAALLVLLVPETTRRALPASATAAADMTRDNQDHATP